MSACTDNFDTQAFLITVLELLVQTLLIALHHHKVFLLEQNFTFAVASLLV
jgi:hypothetical protein